MRTREFNALKVGQRVTVSGVEDGKTFTGEAGTVVRTDPSSDHVRIVDVKFDKSHLSWMFGRDTCRKFNILPEAPKATAPAPVVAVKKRPHGKQEYKGNGKHEWEAVTGSTVRLRVPGGWLYGKTQRDKVMSQTTFVPVPTAVGYAV